MEKLLSTAKKQGGNYATNLTAYAQKIFSLAVRATKIFFANTHETTFESTLFRMNYLSQPITGLSTKISQLFSGRVSNSVQLHIQLDVKNLAVEYVIIFLSLLYIS